MLPDAIVNKKWHIEELLVTMRSKLMFLTGQFEERAEEMEAGREGGRRRERGRGGRRGREERERGRRWGKREREGRGGREGEGEGGRRWKEREEGEGGDKGHYVAKISIKLKESIQVF